MAKKPPVSYEAVELEPIAAPAKPVLTSPSPEAPERQQRSQRGRPPLPGRLRKLRRLSCSIFTRQPRKP